MGERPIRAMHGYHPSEKHSFAALFTNQSEVPEDICALPDLFRLMVREAELAQASNGTNSPLLEGFQRFHSPRSQVYEQA